MASKDDRLSVFISLILRHKPEVINSSIDRYGYMDVQELIDGVNKSGRCITREKLEDIVNDDNKIRYSFNGDKTKIRANQGHSLPADLQLKEVEPPKFLYHGTARERLDNIFEKGILKMDRNYVHLTDNIDTAIQVGRRHGTPVVIQVDSGKMSESKYIFRLSDNNVWLVDFVPNSFLELLKISELDLSLRQYNCLKRAGINDSKELANCTIEKLQKIRNLTKRDIDDLIQKGYVLIKKTR